MPPCTAARVSISLSFANGGADFKKQSTNGSNRPLVVHRQKVGEARKPLVHLKFPKNPLFTTCGHYRQTKTRGQAGLEDFFFICQGLTRIFETKIPVENSVDN